MLYGEAVLTKHAGSLLIGFAFVVLNLQIAEHLEIARNAALLIVSGAASACILDPRFGGFTIDPLKYGRGGGIDLRRIWSKPS